MSMEGWQGRRYSKYPGEASAFRYFRLDSLVRCAQMVLNYASIHASCRQVRMSIGQLVANISLLALQLPYNLIQYQMSSIREAPRPRNSPRTTEDDGTWLSSEGPYLNLIKQSCARQPNLELPDGRNRAVLLCDRQNIRASLFELGTENQISSPTEFPTFVDLQKHFKHPRLDACRRIYLVEGLNPQIVALLGDQLNVDPIFFVTHERTSTYLRWPYEPNLAPCLPSLLDGGQSFTASYYDVRVLSEQLGTFSVVCAESGRDALRTKLGKEWEPTVILHRKCSFWKTIFTNEDDWAGKSHCNFFVS